MPDAEYQHNIATERTALTHMEQIRQRYGRHSLTSCPPGSGAVCQYHTTLTQLIEAAKSSPDKQGDLDA
jgi:hypothetical protein